MKIHRDGEFFTAEDGSIIDSRPTFIFSNRVFKPALFIMFATNILASSNIPDQTLLNQTANTFENISDDFFFLSADIHREHQGLWRCQERLGWQNYVLTAYHLQPACENTASCLTPVCHDATSLARLLPQFDQKEGVNSRARWLCLSAPRRGPYAASSLYLVCCELWALFWNICFPLPSLTLVFFCDRHCSKVK